MRGAAATRKARTTTSRPLGRRWNWERSPRSAPTTASPSLRSACMKVSTGQHRRHGQGHVHRQGRRRAVGRSDRGVLRSRSPRRSGESDCPFDLGDRTRQTSPTLAAGDEATYGVCIDVPDDEIKGGRVSIEEAFASGDRVSWSTKEAVTKSPFAAPTRRRDRHRPAPQHSGGSAATTPLERRCVRRVRRRRVEEVQGVGRRDQGQVRGTRTSRGRRRGQVDDYEDWKEDYDKQIDAIREVGRRSC